MPSAAAAKPSRKRNRKRKRRAASSSSSSSDSSSNQSVGQQKAKSINAAAATITAASPAQSSSSSDSEISDVEFDGHGVDVALRAQRPARLAQIIPSGQVSAQPLPKQVRENNSRSPSPVATQIPTFLPKQNSADSTVGQKEQEMKDRFRKFWMSSVAEGFRDDLEEIRKETNFGTSRLGLLIDSLAAGGDIFTSSQSNGINEIDIILN